MSKQKNPPADLPVSKKDWANTPPEVQTLLLEFQRRQERAQSIQVELNRIFSHDFLNPLTKIAGFVYLMEADLDEAGLLDGAYRDFTQGIKRSLEQELHLLDDVNMLMRLERGEFQTNWKPLSIEMVVNKSLRDYLQTAMVTKPPITIEANPGDTFVQGSAYHISLVIHELIKTSGDTPPDARITIFVEQDASAGRVNVRVERLGYHLNDDEQAEIRATLSRDDVPFPTTWISMYFVAKVIALHGGEFSFECAKDIGTTYSFWLPVSTGAA